MKVLWFDIGLSTSLYITICLYFSENCSFHKVFWSFVIAEIHFCLQNSFKKTIARNKSSAGVNSLEHDNYWNEGIKIATVWMQNLHQIGTVCTCFASQKVMICSSLFDMLKSTFRLNIWLLEKMAGIWKCAEESGFY